MIQRKDALFMAGVTIVTLITCLFAIRLLAPNLLGVPGDLHMVQTSTELPAFYDGVFAAEEVEATEWILLDPVTRIRPRPLVGFGDGFGPHDLLGFRNNAIPAVAEIVVLGDSQSYGNNAILERNWPSHLARSLDRPEQSVYNMAAGGWGAIQYLDAFENAFAFSPRAIIVAFYTGNDPLDSFLMAYNYDQWSELRPDANLTGNDAPPVEFRKDEVWLADLGDLGSIELTPSYRLAANSDHPAVNAGYEIMARVAEDMSESLAAIEDAQTHLIFTIIPTKELVYSKAISRAGLQTPPDYQELLRREKEKIALLSHRISALDNATYVDVVEPMMAAALAERGLYPVDTNGHPRSAGYSVIGHALAEKVGALIGSRHKGVGAVKITGNGIRVYGIGDQQAVLFPSPELLTANGWSSDHIPLIDRHSLAGLKIIVADQVDPEKFGPRPGATN